MLISMMCLEVSSYCGASCVMCVHSKYENKNKTMSFELFKKAVDEASELGLETVVFGLMGDPFMDGGLIKKAKYLKRNYPHIAIRTGATMHIYSEELLSYVDVFSISNYGLTKETYEKVHRGSLVFEKVQENIHKLISLPKDKRPYLHMYFLCLPENEH